MRFVHYTLFISACVCGLFKYSSNCVKYVQFEFFLCDLVWWEAAVGSLAHLDHFLRTGHEQTPFLCFVLCRTSRECKTCMNRFHLKAPRLC